MSSETLSWLQSALGPLLGVIVGASLSGLITKSLDDARFKRERLQKRSELERDAIAAALEWISPMRDAQITASSRANAAGRGDFDHEAYLEGFPYLLGELKKLELSGAQRALLPDDAYPRGIAIVRALDDLKLLGIQLGQKAAMGDVGSAVGAVIGKSIEIDELIRSLEDDLRAAYAATFE